MTKDLSAEVLFITVFYFSFRLFYKIFVKCLPIIIKGNIAAGESN